jgi:hypothetical protein
MTTTPYSVQSKKNGKTYFLHSRLQLLKGGREVTLYYFGGDAREGAIDALPVGYEVTENERTGLPMLRKIKLTTAMDEQIKFILAWEAKVAELRSVWGYAAKKNWGQAEHIEGARMQGCALMLEEYYDAHKIMPPHIRRCGTEICSNWEAQGYVNPEKVQQEVPA